MSEETTPEVITAPELDAPPEWITVKEAAAKLNISERAVQLRVQNNQIAHERTGGKIYVQLGEPLPKRPAPRKAAPPPEAKPEPEPEAEPAGPSEQGALIAQQQSEIEFLRGVIHNHADEIARRDQAEAEYRRLLLQTNNLLEEARHRQMLEAAPAPEPPPAPLPLWKKIFSRNVPNT